ncbi:MAG: glycolate oxidase iron-sulfur subunit [Burkholderiales bacterium]|jgi:glycolate oxidase iron-sulfur subunit|nr:glycolate oxidase iron-sulfur subunit [Burkholderiales bacterium]
METHLADFIRDTPEGREADAILRRCVHCGFCTATCPTYQLLGDELDGPRGRIYLMKQMLEGAPVTARTQLHLDRCLTCRACETTCPSGVEYGRLVDIGRGIVESRVPRARMEALKRRALRAVIPHRTIFGSLLRLGQLVRPLLPASLRQKVPPKSAAVKPWPERVHARKMLVLDGCVQPSLAPSTNVAAARVLDRLGITLVRAPDSGCCGAVSFHLNAHDEALDYMRRNLDAWWPAVEQGAEAIVMTASGCGVMVRDYGHALAHDPAYKERAQRISELTKDISEVIAAERDSLMSLASAGPAAVRRGRIAFHSPCTLQHGQRLNGIVESLLTQLGHELVPVADPHLCCGSAGTYSLLQPELSQRLLANKITALTAAAPSVILTANIGCQSHLQTATEVPVKHWIEAFDDALPQSVA